VEMVARKEGMLGRERGLGNRTKRDEKLGAGERQARAGEGEKAACLEVVGGRWVM